MIVSPDFPSHWKTQLLIRLTGTHESVLCLLKFWAHCQNRKTHRFTGINPSVLASICNWAGEPEKLWNAMLESKFIEVDGEQLIAHQWNEYNGTLISNWKNGSLGGRPKNPRVSHGLSHGVGNASNLSNLSSQSSPSYPSQVGGSVGVVEEFKAGLCKVFNGSNRFSYEDERLMVEIVKAPEWRKELLAVQVLYQNHQDPSKLPRSKSAALSGWPKLVDRAMNPQSEVANDTGKPRAETYEQRVEKVRLAEEQEKGRLDTASPYFKNLRDQIKPCQQS